MSRQINTRALFFFLSAFVILPGCETEDPGPLQEIERQFSIVDFDQLEMGSAFNIRVEESNTYGIYIKGDRRNIEDLDVLKNGSTLVVRYNDSGNRNHTTYITIKMPVLKAANFSGASVSDINGFENDGELNFYLSGASVCQLEAGYRKLNVVLTGASTLDMYGLGDEIHAEVSGASVLNAFDFPVREAVVDFSGASRGKVTVTDELTAVATGASSILYRGNPVVIPNVSGASTVRKD